jgi:hypothetical protein
LVQGVFFKFRGCVFRIERKSFERKRQQFRWRRWPATLSEVFPFLLDVEVEGRPEILRPAFSISVTFVKIAV